MRRVSPNNTVRRCLFPPEGVDEGKQDNMNNVFQEMCKQECERAKQQWNFDIENDAPLPGKNPVFWKGKNENGDWVGVIQNDIDTGDKIDRTDDENKPDESEPNEEAEMQLEATPAPKSAVNKPPTPNWKRSRGNSLTESSAKRKLDL